MNQYEEEKLHFHSSIVVSFKHELINKCKVKGLRRGASNKEAAFKDKGTFKFNIKRFVMVMY